ncbi:MAG: pyridinium-3,5-bisthiocarboxylic acid mononucleotide nickel chelatase [Pyrinomonadaceae bacterium]|nr:pyridinium-3,5-bisthiocarboxylic acid mononucleotide nickel chelatase [Pyrinomonadaceae bacterium]
MRTLFFDCFAGASGDMILGALVAAGADARALRDQLALLNVAGFEVTFETVDRSGISATHAVVNTADQTQHRHLSAILKIIADARLSETIKARASRIFERLGEAEARVHNVPVEKIHFHEVGALDAIVDVVGACVGFELLGIERFVSSPLHVGSGTVEMAHGRFPVPPPAVAELLRDVPVYATDIKGELVTPTGAAIISTVCAEFGALPTMRVAATGYGAGTRQYKDFPNVLRVMVGETEGTSTPAMSSTEGENFYTAGEKLFMIETNLDDTSPQLVGYAMERAFALGALDCFLTPVQMKKNRPGVVVSILCRASEREALTKLLFEETTTLGVRSYEVERRALGREFVTVETGFGAINVKVARRGDGSVSNVAPEYEDCRAAAVRAGVPLHVVEAAARAAVNVAAGESGKDESE